MAGPSNFPSGFPGGVTIRGVPINITNPGKVFWLYNGTASSAGVRGGSDGNKGTFNDPFSTLAGAVTACTAARGDIIIVKPGHAETISSSSALTMSKSGVAVIGLGAGTSRPKFTLDTATTATINVTAANVSFQNCQFVANFLAIAACFTVSAAEFAVENSYIYDTSSVLNFLTIVGVGAGANTADGLTFNNNTVKNLGVTSNNTTINTGSTIDRFTAKGNNLNWAVQNDKPILIDVTTGILTNADIGENKAYRPNTTTAGGSLIKLTGTTSTGWVYRNFVQTLTTTTDLLFTTSVGLGAFENRVSGVAGATGFVIPAVDS
jgi:hypothetical protein